MSNTQLLFYGNSGHRNDSQGRMRQWRHTPRPDREWTEWHQKRCGTPNEIDTIMSHRHPSHRIWLQPWPSCLQNRWCWIAALNTALKFSSTNWVAFWLSPADRQDVWHHWRCLAVSVKWCPRTCLLTYLLTYYDGVCDIILLYDKSERT